MSNNGNTLYNNLFSSMISDIKSYSGLDPLLPWLRGIRKMKETLPPQILTEKLPRFLQKCSETFLADRRYFNDLRYLRVWLQLMDFVDDPKSVLKTMEKNRIGTKKSLFYQAYALYYEKLKKFDAAEKIYHLGVQNLAEPADELQKSYEQFLHRMGRHRNKRVQLQGQKANSRSLNYGEVRGCKDDMPVTTNIGSLSDFSRKAVMSDSGDLQVKLKEDQNGKSCGGDDAVVIKFADTASVGKSKAEDARHYSLVEPTIKMKDSTNAINSMFREPKEPSIASKEDRNQAESGNHSKNGYHIFPDENLETNRPLVEPFEIFVDDEETNDLKEKTNGKRIQTRNHAHTVFAKPNDFHSEGIKDPNPGMVHQSGLREDTIVYRFVGSTTISDEPQVENVCHHGLVDPTVNLKEAMKDINSMFGKPIEFVRKSRPKKHDKAPAVRNNHGEFLILPDDEPENKNGGDDISEPVNFIMQCSPRKGEKVADATNNHTGFLILPDDELDGQLDDALPSSSTGKGSDLFEQTLCTREAMAEINKLFAMPMDF
ncbi:hypothetical protein OROHE_009806 [Orobanche hederae]